MWSHSIHPLLAKWHDTKQLGNFPSVERNCEFGVWTLQASLEIGLAKTSSQSILGSFWKTMIVLEEEISFEEPAFQVLWFLCQLSGVYCNIIVWICQPFVVCAIGIFLNSVRSISYPETPKYKVGQIVTILTMTGLLRGPGGSQGVRVTWTKCRLC